MSRDTHTNQLVHVKPTIVEQNSLQPHILQIVYVSNTERIEFDPF